MGRELELRRLFVIVLIVGILAHFALNRLQRSRIEHMMLGFLFVLTGGALSLNPNIGNTTFASVVGVAFVYLEFVLGILGFFKRES